MSANTEKVDPMPTARRLRALAAIGWPSAELARRIGVHPDDVPRLAKGQRQHVGADIAEAVAGVYEQLSRTDGPSLHTRNRAAKAGYLPPAVWDTAALDGEEIRPSERRPGSRDAEYAALMRDLTVEQFAAPPLDRYARPISTAEANRNRSLLAAAVGCTDDYGHIQLAAAS